MVIKPLHKQRDGCLLMKGKETKFKESAKQKKNAQLRWERKNGRI